MATGIDPWDVPSPAAVIPLLNEESWASLRGLYARGLKDAPLQRCLTVARDRAKCAVVETRYIDSDYRSEYSAFYSRAFATIPDTTHRVHFFDQVVEEGDIWNLPDGIEYLGYMVIRPQVPGVVGRAVLAPPRDLAHAVRTAIEEPVTFFGQSLTVSGVPFLQQDARLDRCAHAAAWICHYTAYRRGEVARQPIAVFSTDSDPTLAVGRPLPSSGLNRFQVSRILTSLNLPPIYYELSSLSDEDLISEWRPDTKNTSDEHVARICRRYLDSGIPLLVALMPAKGGGDGHAYVVCGYERLAKGRMTLVVQDDERGPYLVEERIDRIELGSQTYDWKFLFAPLPGKLWLAGEAAERAGRSWLLGAARAAVKAKVADAQKLLDLHRDGQLDVRTYACRSSDFKRAARTRFADDPAIVKEYSLARFSRYIWVVEAIDKTARDGNGGEPKCVIGEVIYDATSDDLEPAALAVRLPGVISIPKPENPRWDVHTSASWVVSGGVLQP